jgi:hypothetical protein
MSEKSERTYGDECKVHFIKKSTENFAHILVLLIIVRIDVYC